MTDNLVPLYDDGIKQVLLNPDTDNLVFKGFSGQGEETLALMLLANAKVQDEKKKFMDKQKTLHYQLSRIEERIKDSHK